MAFTSFSARTSNRCFSGGSSSSEVFSNSAVRSAPYSVLKFGIWLLRTCSGVMEDEAFCICITATRSGGNQNQSINASEKEEEESTSLYREVQLSPCRGRRRWLCAERGWRGRTEPCGPDCGGTGRCVSRCLQCKTYSKANKTPLLTTN